MKNTFTFYAVLTIAALIAASCNGGSDHKPVNPYASEKAQALLGFMYDISGNYTLSGQHNYISTGSKYTRLMEEMTGRSPVVWGSDFSFCYQGDHPESFQHCGPLNLSDPADSVYYTGVTMPEARQEMIEEAKRMYAKGHIITLMWHGCFPADGECCQGESIWAMENRPGDSIWNQLVTDGTALNDAWKAQADKVAGYLAQLRDAGIPVLWRPYHEMNGVWFWWCDHPGDQGFKRLWIMMYDYFTTNHKLDNLIWVWDANAPREIPGDEAFDYSLFYPGNNYVDILAADVYRNDYKPSHYTDLVKLGNGKPVALGEVGEMPTLEILDDQPGWTWFMTWAYHSLKRNSEEQFKTLYNSRRVLTLDEISRTPEGVYAIHPSEGDTQE
ncbi:MAG TPA: glycosyl hydrolase [Bacteroidales bacterium]|nr:glycosyl hydrolase [Bacteroidales bacterium]